MNNTPFQNQSDHKRGSCLGIFIYLLTIGWLMSTSLARYLSTFFASANPGPASPSQEFTASLTHTLMLLVPLMMLSLRWSDWRYRPIYQAWLWAAGAMLLLSPAFLIEVDEAQTMAVAQIGLLLVFVVILIIQRNYRQNKRPVGKISPPKKSKKERSSAWYLSALLGFFVLAPWLWNGAMGSFLDSLLFVTLSALISVSAILLIEIFIVMPLQEKGNLSMGDYFLAATGIGGVLQILTAATVFPFGGMHILLMLSLPVLGWSVAAIIFFSVHNQENDNQQTELASPQTNVLKSWTGPAWLLIFLGLAGPLLMIDADELAAVISMSSGEIFFVALQSAGLSFLVALAAGIGLMVLLAWKIKQSSLSPSIQSSTTLLNSLRFANFITGILLLAIYFLPGQPGLHGERMLVIMSEQKDVSYAKDITDYQARRQAVFDDLTTQAQLSQASVRQLLDWLHIPYTPYYLLNAIETVDNPILRLYLSTHPEVERILDSPRMRPLPKLASESFMQQNIAAPEEIPWNLRMIHADQVWQETGITGKGILIGQSDSGVQGDHPDLAAQYRGQGGNHDYNWFDPWNGSPVPVDLGGHGTHTLGTALGKTTGVAPQAQWIACVNLARNLGNPALYLDCMQFMFAPFPQDGDPFTQGEPSKGAHVLNNSWGCPEFEGCDPQVFLPSVRALEAAGVFVVAGAGNEGPGCSTVSSPLPLYAEVLAAGAIDRQGNLADFSSLGPVTSDGSLRVKPDLVAPGVDVLSTLPGSTYGSFSGTSMASPHVAGVVALIWSANPSLVGDIETTRMIITASTQPYTGYLPACSGVDQIPSTAVGYGILDAYAAVQMALGK